ncbi:hypothetical protein NliqN6_6459 [Naganishia liquefaciens]|uniref:Histidine kinase n=1 Tax=Naganishia liquefaciens TaxID=104408 RepID=A0A8H3YJD2_9TREE|nr:hypothetical protein NliqN6_6459 [Naganishia liquefaciens]
MHIPARSGPLWDDFLFDSDTTNLTAIASSGPPLYPLQARWHWPLVLTSYFISALGGYTSTQLMSQVRASKGVRARMTWIGLASVVFGGCGIWSMHFVSMLALDLGIPVAYNIPVTILSAIVAITATFTTFGYELINHYARKFRRIAELNRMLHPVHPSDSRQPLIPPPLDPSTELPHELPRRNSYDTLSPKTRASADLPPASLQDKIGTPARRRWTGVNQSDENVIKYRMDGHRDDPVDISVTTSSMLGVELPNQDPGRGVSVVHFEQPSAEMGFPSQGTSSLFPAGFQREGLITPPASDSVNPDPFAFERSSNGSFSSDHLAMLYGPGLGQSWKGDDELLAEESRRASLIVLAKVVATRFTYKVVVKGVLMGLAVVSMHYTGMLAMRMEGTIIWNWWLVALSVVDACLVCMIAIIFMPLSQSSFTSQILFSLVSGFGVSSMHYCGMFAANFYTVLAPEDRHAATVQSHTLPWSIAVIAFASCLISYVLLAHTVTSSRDELVEAIRTKRALWRTMAEKEAAVRSDKLKMDFISVASHEIRTPLHVIAGYVDLLAQTDLTQEQQEYIAALRSGCASIRHITSDVLDFAKLQNPSAESRARSAEIDLRKIAMEIVQGCSSSTYMASVRNAPLQNGSSSAPADRPDIILEFDRDVPLTVFLDEVYVTRILMNLLNNALKFCSDGYILVRISMHDISGEGQPSLCISVRDTGIGIAKSFQTQIFSPFQQADTSLTRKHTGTGLGLAICYQLATSMHGNMGIWSQQGVGAGTELSVYLPINILTYDSDESNGRRLQPVHLDQPLSAARSVRSLQDPPTVGFLTRSAKKQSLLLEAFSAYGFRVEDLLAVSVSRAMPMDCAWIDLEVIARYPDKITQLLSIPSLSVYILCENPGMTSRDSAMLAATRNARAQVILMPRPINIPDATTWLSDSATASIHGGRVLNVAASNGYTQMISPPLTVVPTLGTTPEDEQAVDGLLKTGTHLRVLLVDDNLINQRLGVRILSKMKYSVDTAENGQVALDKIAAGRDQYGLVLMDCQMPVLDGFEATRRIRQAERAGSLSGHLPVIALTANVSPDSRERCIEAGADHFLAKPLISAELHECIQRFM